MDSTSTISSQHSRNLGAEEQAATSPSPSANLVPSAQQLLLALYGPVAEPLAEVERLLRAELQSRYELLQPLLRHGTQLGGKRMRPALLLLSAEAAGRRTHEHVVLATVIEMVHTATLIHDDVLDEADQRRHVQTVNARWGNHTSILLGDYLFAQSFRLAATHSTTEMCALVGEAARRVCEGELRQVLQREALDLSEETYLEIIQAKTAELCRVACEVGAMRGGGDDACVAALAEYGTAMGIAFQIADDYLDVWGEDAKVGKTLGTDLQQGKMTLPMIRLLSTATGTQRAKILDLLSNRQQDCCSQIRGWLEESDACRYTESVARRYGYQAIEALSVLPESPAKEALQAIAQFAVERKF